MSVWTKSLFNNKKRDWNLFAKNHRKEGTFTDNNGIMVLATAQYLGVILKIVPTSGDSRTPFYCIPDDVVDAETDGRPILWLGLHQDNTDRRYDGKAGHYQSLIPSVTSTSPPNPIPLSITVYEPMATNIDSSVAVAVTANTTPDEIPVSVKLSNENEILLKFPKDTSMFISSLDRINTILQSNDVTANDLFFNSLCTTLYCK